ncbi:MAG: 1,4-alpha-glucan-branching enzyme [Verrucomicrobiaceae bacterium]|nr:1,4-alpha-glucan-branching enzyme [Verrucomicrobiaceae bacterium]
MANKTRVIFSVQAPIGSVVTVAGDFNGWDCEADELSDSQGDGNFTGTVEISDVRFEYKYLVNGIWTLANDQPWQSNDGGAANHVWPVSKGISGRILSPLSKDPYLNPFQAKLDGRRQHRERTEDRLLDGKELGEFASAHEYYGLHEKEKEWVLREWAPNATSMRVFGEFCDWDSSRGYAFDRLNEKGDWEVCFPKTALKHQDRYRLHLTWRGGKGERLPAYARRVVQNDQTKAFDAQAWCPDSEYSWRYVRPSRKNQALLVYEAHVGIAQEEAKVGTYVEFREKTLPRIAKAGYNAIQLMALTEHPYYGSFGYHVANFFACSSRFGTPEELKELVDEAHRLGIAVIMDLVHSHATKNELEGLSTFDGTAYQYFHEGARGNHDAWDSRCFNYQKPEVLHFLLSNCRYWLDEFRIDGFRFDGVTSMLYTHHGLGVGFNSYDRYFDHTVDEDAYTYLALANQLIHEFHPDAITIAEDVSGMPGLGAAIEEGGCGFDVRMAMGVPDHWFKLTDKPDEDWNVEQLWYELTNRRQDERTLSYVESHDQALVGGKSFIFQLIDAAMYDSMACDSNDIVVDRGVALHKLARLLTLATSDAGYLTFMGNEFGHPEWLDFPREGNGWSCHYARRQWSLRDNPALRYHGLGEFDEAMINTVSGATCLSRPAELLHAHAANQVLAFRRGDLMFVFNFHPTHSHEGYAVPVPAGTACQLSLDSDASCFAGHGRLSEEQMFSVENGTIQAYLPTRTALVLSVTSAS